MEIRHALALKQPMVLLHESDVRYGGFDFRAAHAEAPADLQELLDQHESLPFRRRGYGEFAVNAFVQRIHSVLGSTTRARRDAADRDW